ncbi:ClpX C4-type zinc finger protein [Aquabacterium humicola]|uniref:ClpX C4-type zinc finger protein n=1 Tax=Aquabacterium humicola TaxID=3237377 RepID=UPI0032EB4619
MGGVVFTANVEPGPARSETQQWLSSALDIGDEVRVRVVESQEADPPLDRAIHGTAVDPGSPQLCCSVCKRHKNSVAQLLAVGAFSICGECVELCYESLGRRRQSEA